MGDFLKVIVSPVVGMLKDLNKSRKLKRLIKQEMKSILQQLDNDTVRQNPSIALHISTGVYDANSACAIDPFSNSEAQTVTDFYSKLKILKEYDKQNEEINKLHPGDPTIPQRLNNLGNLKESVRTELIKLGKEILGNK